MSPQSPGHSRFALIPPHPHGVPLPPLPLPYALGLSITGAVRCGGNAHFSNRFRSPSPFALFSNRHNTSTTRGEEDILVTGPPRVTSSTSSRFSGSRTFSPKKLNPTELEARRLKINIVNPSTGNLRGGRGGVRFSRVSTDLEGLLYQYYSSMLLMLAPRKPELEQNDGRNSKDQQPSTSVFRQPLPRLEIDVTQSTVPFTNDSSDKKITTTTNPNQPSSTAVEANNSKSSLILTIPVPEKVDVNINVELLPIKKRRLRQLEENEGQENERGEQMQQQDLMHKSSISSSSTSTKNATAISDTNTTSSTLSTSQVYSGQQSSSSNAIDNFSKDSFPLVKTKVQQQVPRRAGKSYNASNVKGITFIDHDSQAWWNRAHMAYAFHPKRYNRNQNQNSVPEQTSRQSTSSSRNRFEEEDVYNLDDARSPAFRSWIQSFYPERDFSQVTFGRSGYGAGDDRKGLLDKLGLVNPLDLPPTSQDQNHPDGVIARGRFPPWITEEGLKEFDILNMELKPNRRQKYHYD